MNLFLCRAVPNCATVLRASTRTTPFGVCLSTKSVCNPARTFSSVQTRIFKPATVSSVNLLLHSRRLFSLLPKKNTGNAILLLRRPGHRTSLVLRFSSLPRSHRNMMQPDKNKSLMMMLTALVVMVLGLSYAAVPLYRLYCQKTGKGGQAVLDDDINNKVAAMQKVTDRKITITFDAEKSSRLAWDFKPSQHKITCSPGETVLAFYTARNHLDRPVNGIATYTILPYEAGQYFNKIQCFCFEEQQLNAEEEVDLPVFFYIDPEYSKDPYLFECNDIVLSYNFFETKEGYKLPKPPSFRAHLPPFPNKSSPRDTVVSS